MPTNREVVPNTKLAGHEIRKILAADFERLLDNEGLLSAHIAFGRVSYTIDLKMHIDNPFHPESHIHTASRQIGRNIVSDNPDLAAIEPSPLDNPSADATVEALRLTRNITSPNAERVRHEMPVPAIRRQADGTTTTEKITYPLDALPDLPPEDVAITDTSAEAAAAWGQPIPQAKLPTVEDDSAQQLANAVMCKCGHAHGNHALSGICTKCPGQSDNPCVQFRDVAIPDQPEGKPQAWAVVPGDGNDYVDYVGVS